MDQRVGIRVVLAAALGSGMVAACGGGSSESAQHDLACGQIASAFRASDATVKITSAADVAATATVPAYCDVRGTIKGNVKFAIHMPNAWNGRFQMVGNGGKAGVISFPAMISAVQDGYATSSTDTGHDAALPAETGSRFGYDAEFGDDREIDFGYRAVHLTAQTSKEIINAHYPKNIEYSYWNGCSTGGRQGLMEVQRYPADFDGYVVGAPVYDYTRQQITAPALLSNLYKNGITGGSVIPTAKLAMVGNIVYNGNGGNYAGCDAIDGVKDGQIRNPLKCNFDPAIHVPACGATDGPNCLTSAELTAFKATYAGRPDVNVPPLPVGAENTEGGWGSWLVASKGATPLLHNVMFDAFQYLLFQPDRPNFNYLTDFDWNTDLAKMAKAKETYNATNADLRNFAVLGKKIIMYHGWADPGANPMGTIQYKTAVDAAVGGSSDPFLKLYMVPGMGHCSGGPGHTNVNWMAAVSSWVEKGQAPVGIIGTKPATPTSSRPHCPYPQEAVYNGTGDVNAAASYTCRVP